MSAPNTNENNADSNLDDSLNELLKELNGELNGSSDKSTSSSSSDPSQNFYKLSSFPTEMSCSQAFDELVACYSIGGQFRHVYRYGGISYCNDRWAKAKFCLKMKAVWDENERAKRVAKYHMEKLAKQKKEGGSSEDIWSVRTVPVSNPFQGASDANSN